jgi:hypothetical protein
MNDFSLGWDNTSPATMLDPRCVTDCKNFDLTNKKGLSKRGGMTKLYPVSLGAADIEQLYEYKAPNGTDYVVVAVATTLKYYSAGWADFKTGLTTGLNYSFATHLGSCYATNGTDANVRIYNTTSYTAGIPVPAAKPTVALGAAGVLTGDYYYKYTYRRDTNGHSTDGNPSAVSTLIQPSSQKVTVSVVASADSNVNHIVIYRTLASGSLYYKVAEVANTTADYTDNIADNALTTLLETDNDAPPKCKFLTVHKDRMFYANCPDETDGAYLVVWSKSGKSECVPSDNFQYFDRADGEPITGIASLGDYLCVFKRNKISVIAGDLDESSILYSIAMGIGCIAPYAILPFEDKVVFLSEEGWKATDGKNVYALSENINASIADGWANTPAGEVLGENISAAWYPEKSQMHFNINHTTLGQRVFVGHFLFPLLMIGKGSAQQDVGAIVAWTYHDYASHELTTFGTYTDASGITRLIAGDNAGWIYVLDSGTFDTGADGVENAIATTFQTDWVAFKEGRGFTKTVRRGFLDYVASGATTLTLNVEKDFSDTDDTQSISGTGGVGSAIGAKFHLSGTAKRYRYTITESSKFSFNINGLSIFYRIEGRR